MKRFICTQHESLAIEADTPEQAMEKFLSHLSDNGWGEITIEDEETGEEVTPE